MSLSPTIGTSFTQLYALRYLSIAGTTVLAYDTILTLPEEVRCVWYPLVHWTRGNRLGNRQKPMFLIPRLLVLFIRYTMLAIAGVYLKVLMPSRDMGDNWCRSASTIISVIDILIEATGTGIVLQRLCLLWNFGRRCTILLVCIFAVLQSLSTLFAISSVVQFGPSEILNRGVEGFRGFLPPQLMSCAMTKTSRFSLLSWVPAAALDVVAFFLFFLNALSRPRAESQRLLYIIYRDGFIYFFTTFCMRTMNVLFTSISDPSNASLLFMAYLFSGTTVTVAATRSFLRLFHISQKGVLYDRWPADGNTDELAEHEYCVCEECHDETELRLIGGGVDNTSGHSVEVKWHKSRRPERSGLRTPSR